MQNPIEMIIRRARKEDIPRLLALLGQVLKTHVELRPDTFVDGTTKYREHELLAMIEDDLNPVFVIEDNGLVLGSAFCQIRVSKTPHLVKRQRTFYIDDFCIDESVRGKHVGTTLFAFLKEEAKRSECQEMALNCWTGNDPADAFYRKMGFKPRSSIMELIIE